MLFTSKIKHLKLRPSLSTRRKHLKVPGKKNKHTTLKTGFSTQRSRLSSKKSTLKMEIELEEFTFAHL